MIIQGKVEGNLHNFTVCTCAQLVFVDTTNVMNIFKPSLKEICITLLHVPLHS